MRARPRASGAYTIAADAVLITETLLLLGLDPRRGVLAVQRRGVGMQGLSAAALLADLIVLDRLRPAGRGDLVAESAVPAAHVLLTEALQRLGTRSLTPAQALLRVGQGIHRLPQRVLDGLARRDLLHRIPNVRGFPALGVRYPLRSVQARQDAEQVARSAAGAPTTVRSLALLQLLDTAGLLTTFLDAGLHERATRALLGIESADPQDPGLLALARLRRALLD
ncbi:MAG: GPP34 family phosphoprotein [Xanthomonadaceae bacterium]|nr:GPP34 family phosphoprotein [Xanthomonadaceae bacterium]